MSNIQPIKVGDRICRLRIYARNVEVVQTMLGTVTRRDKTGNAVQEPKGFMDAMLDAMDNPVKNVVPFLWGANQPGPGGSAFSEADAYDLYDSMVDEGYAGSDWSELIGKICVASGFFKPAVVEMLTTTLATAMDQMMSKLTTNGFPKPAL